MESDTFCSLSFVIIFQGRSFIYMTVTVTSILLQPGRMLAICKCKINNSNLMIFFVRDAF